MVISTAKKHNTINHYQYQDETGSSSGGSGHENKEDKSDVELQQRAQIDWSQQDVFKYGIFNIYAQDALDNGEKPYYVSEPFRVITNTNTITQTSISEHNISSDISASNLVGELASTTSGKDGAMRIVYPVVSADQSGLQQDINGNYIISEFVFNPASNPNYGPADIPLGLFFQREDGSTYSLAISTQEIFERTLRHNIDDEEYPLLPIDGVDDKDIARDFLRQNFPEKLESFEDLMKSVDFVYASDAYSFLPLSRDVLTRNQFPTHNSFTGNVWDIGYTNNIILAPESLQPFTGLLNLGPKFKFPDDARESVISTSALAVTMQPMDLDKATMSLYVPPGSSYGFSEHGSFPEVMGVALSNSSHRFLRRNNTDGSFSYLTSGLEQGDIATGFTFPEPFYYSPHMSSVVEDENGQKQIFSIPLDIAAIAQRRREDNSAYGAINIAVPRFFATDMDNRRSIGTGPYVADIINGMLEFGRVGEGGDDIPVEFFIPAESFGDPLGTDVNSPYFAIANNIAYLDINGQAAPGINGGPELYLASTADSYTLEQPFSRPYRMYYDASSAIVMNQIFSGLMDQFPKEDRFGAPVLPSVYSQNPEFVMGLIKRHSKYDPYNPEAFRGAGGLVVDNVTIGKVYDDLLKYEEQFIDSYGVTIPQDYTIFAAITYPETRTARDAPSLPSPALTPPDINNDIIDREIAVLIRGSEINNPLDPNNPVPDPNNPEDNTAQPQYDIVNAKHFSLPLQQVESADYVGVPRSEIEGMTDEQAEVVINRHVLGDGSDVSGSTSFAYLVPPNDEVKSAGTEMIVTGALVSMELRLLIPYSFFPQVIEETPRNQILSEVLEPDVYLGYSEGGDALSNGLISFADQDSWTDDFDRSLIDIGRITSNGAPAVLVEFSRMARLPAMEDVYQQGIGNIGHLTDVDVNIVLPESEHSLDQAELESVQFVGVVLEGLEVTSYDLEGNILEEPDSPAGDILRDLTPRMFLSLVGEPPYTPPASYYAPLGEYYLPIIFNGVPGGGNEPTIVPPPTATPTSDGLVTPIATATSQLQPPNPDDTPIAPTATSTFGATTEPDDTPTATATNIIVPSATPVPEYTTTPTPTDFPYIPPPPSTSTPTINPTPEEEIDPTATSTITPTPTPTIPPTPTSVIATGN